MGQLSTTAWVLHDLGLAAGFGGQLFGKLALHPAVEVVDSKQERGRVLSKAWQGYNVVNAGSLATVAATWLAGRTMISGRGMGKGIRQLVLAKDLLVVGTLATGIACMACGYALSHETEAKGVPLESGGEPARETPPRAAKLQEAVNLLGDLNLAFMAGVIGVTTILAFRSGESQRWGILAKWLP